MSSISWLQASLSSRNVQHLSSARPSASQSLQSQTLRICVSCSHNSSVCSVLQGCDLGLLPPSLFCRFSDQAWSHKQAIPWLRPTNRRPIRPSIQCLVGSHVNRRVVTVIVRKLYKWLVLLSTTLNVKNIDSQRVL